jgi:Transposase DDE domain
VNTTQLIEALMALVAGVAPRQRITVAKMVASVWLATTLSITAMARAAAMRFGDQPRTLHKSFDRLLSSESLDPMALYQAHCLAVIGERKRVEIAIDWLSLRNDSVRVLLAAVCDEDGRAWPVLALSIPTKQRKRRQREIEGRMLNTLRRFIPAQVTVIVLADRGFDGVDFRAELGAVNFRYVIRVRGNLIAVSDGKKSTTRKLAGQVGHGPIRRENVLLTAKRVWAGAFVSCWDEKSKTPWLLVTDLPDSATVVAELYARRFRIEECIRDIKNARLGLGLEEFRTRSIARWTVLLAVTILGYTVIRRCGTIARDRGLAKKFSTSGRRSRSHSTFSLGRFHANASPAILAQATGFSLPLEIMRAA